MSERIESAGHDETQDSTKDSLELRARKAIEIVGFGLEVVSVSFIPEGRSHHVFDIRLKDGSSLVARFEKLQLSDSPDGVRRDFHFNGPLSLERERNLMELVREEAGLPAPKVLGIYQTDHDRFLLVERLEGVHWSEYISRNNYSLKAYLNSLGFLGKDLAKAHSVHFESFGDAMGKNDVNPGTIRDFSQRVDMFTELKLQRAIYSGSLSGEEIEAVFDYLQSESKSLKEAEQDSLQTPVLILTDIHPMNFFVDKNSGEPSGYFDLEFCQAGHKALEFFSLRTTLLNYFEGVSNEAEAALLEGYEQGGGSYNPEDLYSKKLEHVLAIGYLVAAVTTYHNASDGLRDNWSSQFKGILFDAMRGGSVDFSAISGVFRSKTGQPRFSR